MGIASPVQTVDACHLVLDVILFVIRRQAWWGIRGLALGHSGDGGEACSKRE